MQVHSHPTQQHCFRITVTTVKTIQGKAISEDQVDAWVTEAENGYEIEFLLSRGILVQKAPRHDRTSADNALAESFNATLKREVLRDRKVFDNPISCPRSLPVVHALQHPQTALLVQLSSPQ